MSLFFLRQFGANEHAVQGRIDSVNFMWSQIDTVNPQAVVYMPRRPVGESPSRVNDSNDSKRDRPVASRTLKSNVWIQTMLVHLV